MKCKQKSFPAPIWFAIITNIIALVLIIVCLDDPKDEEETKEGNFKVIRKCDPKNVQRKRQYFLWLRFVSDSPISVLFIFHGFSSL